MKLKVGSGCSLLKSQQRGQVDRKVCFILYASKQGWCWEGRRLFKGQLSSQPSDNQEARAFTDRGRELHAETAESARTVILKLVIGGLTSMILIVLSSVTVQFQGWFVFISWGQFLESWQLWQLVSQPQSVHHAVNFSPLRGFRISKTV